MLLVSGFFSLWAMESGHIWTVQTYTWLLLLMLCLRRILNRGRAAWAVGASLVIALMVFGGGTQTLIYALYALGLYTAFDLNYRLSFAGEELKLVARKGALCLAGILLGVLLASVQLLPSREFLGESIREDGVTRQYLSPYPMHFGVFGSSMFLEHGRFWLGGGKALFALALLSLFGSGRYERYVLWCVGVACALYYVMPDWFYELFIEHISMLASMRGTVRIISILAFLLVLLSSFGLSRLVTTTGDERVWKRSWLLFAALLSTLMLLPFTRESVFVGPSWGIAGLSLAAAVCALFMKEHRAIPVALLLCALTAETVIYHSGRYSTGDEKVYEVNEAWPEFSAGRDRSNRMALFHPFRTDFHSDSVAMLTGDRVVFGTHALMLSRYARLMREVGRLDLAPIDGEGKLMSEGFLATGLGYSGVAARPRSLQRARAGGLRNLIAASRGRDHFGRREIPSSA